jgi:phosphodiesterase/alkaline phosphatase D-like protein
MGSRQENWFYRSLKESKDRGAAWRIVGNQIIFSRIYEDDSGILSGDNWNVRQDSSQDRKMMDVCTNSWVTGLHREPKQDVGAPL